MIRVTRKVLVDKMMEFISHCDGHELANEAKEMLGINCEFVSGRFNIVDNPNGSYFEDCHGYKLNITKGDYLKFVIPTDIVICDPCYVFSHEDDELNDVWLDFLHQIEGTDMQNNGIIEFKGAKILYGMTKHGDGWLNVHTDLVKIGDMCSVDTGMLCVLSREDAEKINPDFSHIVAGVLVSKQTGIIKYSDGDWKGTSRFCCITNFVGLDWNDYE